MLGNFEIFGAIRYEAIVTEDTLFAEMKENSHFNKYRAIRDYLNLCKAILFLPIYIPHLLVFITFLGAKKAIISDLKILARTLNSTSLQHYYIFFTILPISDLNSIFV